MPLPDDKWLESSRPPEWARAEGVPLVLFDILGFGKIIDRNELAKVARYVKTLGQFGDIANRTVGTSGYRLDADVRFIDSVIYSDSVLIFARENRTRSVVNLVDCAIAVFNSAISMGFGLRGAITKGELFVSDDKRIVLGKGLVSAYRLEQRQAWLGAVCDEDAPWTEYERNELRILKDTGRFMSFDVPLWKDPKHKDLGIETRTMAALGWPGGWNTPPRDLRARLSELTGPAEGHAAEYIERGQSFAAYCVEHDPLREEREKMLEAMQRAARGDREPGR